VLFLMNRKDFVMTTNVASFVHQYHAGVKAETLLLLHGTGGDESDLLEIGGRIAPGWNLLSPRGRVLENGMPRFFRRLAAGVFDEADLRKQTAALADFVKDAAAEYGLDPAKVFAAGYSNGANIAASVLLLRPETLAGAVLWRAMVPLRDELKAGALRGKRVWISAGAMDPYNAGDQASALAGMLRAGGAEVDVTVQRAGHGLTDADVSGAATWLAARAGAERA
jgi:phospholipase/carboxylesterase